MKKQLSLFVWATAAFGMAVVLGTPAVVAAGNSEYGGTNVVNLSDGSDSRATLTSIEYKKYKVSGDSTIYGTEQEADVYYVPATTTRAQMYKNYEGCGDAGCAAQPKAVVLTGIAKPAKPVAPVKTVNAKTPVRTNTLDATQMHYLADPFFQPAGGRVGSVTDVSWNKNSYNFRIDNSALTDDAGTWNMSALVVKEDISFGITDELSIIGAVQFISADYEIDWRLPATGNDSDSSSKIDMWGIGAQWKFVDNADWVAHLAGFYQWREHSNTVALDIKAGYKIENSTVYGLLRGYYVGYDNDTYGNGIEKDGAGILFAFQRDAKNTFSIEGGIGLFTALSPDWTMNIEGLFGKYDWHNQMSLRAAIGWQPADSFALNLYAKASVYDSANSKENIGVYFWDSLVPVPTEVGTIGISKYADYSVGLQAILYF